jgi:hypothetical protein
MAPPIDAAITTVEQLGYLIGGVAEAGNGRRGREA